MRERLLMRVSIVSPAETPSLTATHCAEIDIVVVQQTFAAPRDLSRFATSDSSRGEIKRAGQKPYARLEDDIPKLIWKVLLSWCVRRWWSCRRRICASVRFSSAVTAASHSPNYEPQ